DVERNSDLGQERGKARNGNRRVHTHCTCVGNIHRREVVESLRGANQPARHTEPKCPGVAGRNNTKIKIDWSATNEGRTGVNTEWSQIGDDGKSRGIRIDRIALRNSYAGSCCRKSRANIRSRVAVVVQ